MFKHLADFIHAFRNGWLGVGCLYIFSIWSLKFCHKTRKKTNIKLDHTFNDHASTHAHAFVICWKVFLVRFAAWMKWKLQEIVRRWNAILIGCSLEFQVFLCCRFSLSPQNLKLHTTYEALNCYYYTDHSQYDTCSLVCELTLGFQNVANKLNDFEGKKVQLLGERIYFRRKLKTQLSENKLAPPLTEEYQDKRIRMYVWMRARLDLNWLHIRWVKCVTVSSYCHCWIACSTVCSCCSVFQFSLNFFSSLLFVCAETLETHASVDSYTVHTVCLCECVWMSTSLLAFRRSHRLACMRACKCI